MTNQSLQIKAVPLRLALKTTIRHAAATRNEGESIWGQAKRRDHAGYGEGCPRAYVAGDELTSSLTWVRDNFPEGRVNFATRDDLSEWAFSHEKVIDQYPAAWCAVEMAVLNLLAGEKGCPVENYWDSTVSFMAATPPFWEMIKSGLIPPWPILSAAISRLAGVYSMEQIPLLVYPSDYFKTQGIPCKKQYNLWIIDVDHGREYVEYRYGKNKTQA